jgi:hypothetical protein
MTTKRKRQKKIYLLHINQHLGWGGLGGFSCRSQRRGRLHVPAPARQAAPDTIGKNLRQVLQHSVHRLLLLRRESPVINVRQLRVQLFHDLRHDVADRVGEQLWL